MVMPIVMTRAMKPTAQPKLLLFVNWIQNGNVSLVNSVSTIPGNVTGMKIVWMGQMSCTVSFNKLTINKYHISFRTWMAY